LTKTKSNIIKMSQENQESRVEMAALKMPTEQMGFIKRNSKLAAKAGKLMIMIHDLKNSVSNMEKILEKPELFKPYFEDGTEEELNAFFEALKRVNASQDGMFHFKDIPKEAFDQVKEKLGDHMVATEISTGKTE